MKTQSHLMSKKIQQAEIRYDAILKRGIHTIQESWWRNLLSETFNAGIQLAILARLMNMYTYASQEERTILGQLFNAFVQSMHPDYLVHYAHLVFNTLPLEWHSLWNDAITKHPEAITHHGIFVVYFSTLAS
jgi:hypothetical protein